MDSPLNSEGSRLDAVKTIDRKNLVNRLNYLNFQNKDLLSYFKHKRYKRMLALKVKPHPCTGEKLHCSWEGPIPADWNPDEYTLDHLQLEDGLSTITVSSDSYTLNNDGLSLTLPEQGHELTSRRIQRHKCSTIRVQMIQNGIVYKGTLLSFSPESFSVAMDESFKQNSLLFNPEEPVIITLISSRQLIFSGEAKIFSPSSGERNSECIFFPLLSSIRRFPHQDERFKRTLIVPSPNLSFKHPLSNQHVSLSIMDLSGSGFSVEEELRLSTLLPGMIIPEAEIDFSVQVKINCRIQVLYRNVVEGTHKGATVKVGICFLDMSPGDHTQLMSLLFQAQNKNLYLGREIDTEAFWQFIFETGFIYPQKYSSLSRNKESVRGIYRKMYTHSPEVFKYITYQDKGRILGHIAMLRVYENAWMLHHHASSVYSSHNAGISVMVMMADYAASAHRIPSLHLDYLMLYYRAENKFPSKVFGGYSRSLNNPKGCSEDEFAYLEFSLIKDVFFDELESIHLLESTVEDLVEFEEFYSSRSGGLLLDAMDVHPHSTFNKDVKETYRKDNLTREFSAVSLKKGETLLAVFLIDRADYGINMSELSNSIKVFVINEQELSKELFTSAMNELVKKYYGHSAHALIYPLSYADANELSYEKKYRLWITGFNHTDEYFKFIRRLLRMHKTDE